jgi:predicted nucleic acid-binding protein
VNEYPDASFVFSLYVDQAHTNAVRAHLATMKEPLPVGSLLRFEFANAVRSATQRGAISAGTATAALAAFEADVDAGRVVLAAVPWERVHAEAERISNAYSWRKRHTAFDILHVATALTAGAKVLLTFDSEQAALAKAEGLKVKP